MNNRRKYISSALFDVKPVDSRGNLDVEKIKKVAVVINLRGSGTKQEHKQRAKAIELKVDDVEKENTLVSQNIVVVKNEELENLENLDKYLESIQLSSVEQEEKKEEELEEIVKYDPVEDLEQFYFPEVASKKYSMPNQPFVHNPAILKHDFDFKSLYRFLIAGFLIALIVPAAVLLDKGFGIKENVMSSSLAAYQNLLDAKESLEQADWRAAEQSFSSAQSDFVKAHQEVSQLGRLTLAILGQMPGGSAISSGTHLIRVGESLARAGQTLTSAIGLFSFDSLFNSIDLSNDAQPLSHKISLSRDDLINALADVRMASKDIEKVEIDALPDDIQSEVAKLKEKLPLVEDILNQAVAYSGILLKILGHDNPRQYLLIFQNNSEIRATGGFIGTYGLLELDQGKISNLLIDGIFNVDGQLHEKIIPPQPIQRVSTAWSMHDANWFADFPTSAQKISWFYEKAGGPTVDGVISLTPTVMERLLQLTGPIEMPEYGVNLNPDNFVELIQYKVEVDYDKELNRPKQILTDFTPKFIKSLSELSLQKRTQAIEIILNSLEEKHMLIYFKDSSLQKMIINEKWAGQLLTTDQDYLSVVSSNINGYKTDKMIKETINHQAEIQQDGSIIDTLTITRQHQGGNEKYEWFNRVNTNYLRVYLPLGSELISANGQTLELYSPPIDYQKQGFKQDALVSSIEDRMIIDPKTGTHIFEENKKTVFANWVYVSPGETVVLTYKYKLPYKISLTSPSDSYSLLIQKQSGSLGSGFTHQLKFPENWSVSWKYPENLNIESGSLNLNSDLKIDRFLGVTFKLW